MKYQQYHSLTAEKIVFIFAVVTYFITPHAWLLNIPTKNLF